MTEENDISRYIRCYIQIFLEFDKIDFDMISSITDRNKCIVYNNNFEFLLKSARSIFLSAASRKFIHYTKPAVLDGTGSDSWTPSRMAVHPSGK